MPILKRDSVICAEKLDPVVDRQFISVDGAAGNDLLRNQSHQRLTAYFGNSFRNDLASALDNRHNWSFLSIVSGWVSLASLLHAAYIGFIHLNRWSLQLQIALRKQSANLLEHAPGSFVSDSALPLNLLRGNTAASRTHQKHGIEPSFERSGGLFQNSARKWINLSTAVIAAISSPLSNAVMLALLLALLAISNATRPSLIHQIIKAGVIIREFFVDVSVGVSECFRYVLFDWHLNSSVSIGRA